MRTSHQRIHSLISQEKTKITDKELFSSVPYRAYLSDIAETAVGKFKRKISIITEWDESPNAFVAYTDNKVITLNTGNRLTAEFVERIHKNLSLIGITAHEIGHILYTDFTVLSMFMQAVDNGTFYPVIPKNLEDDDEENLNEILDIIKEKDETKNTLIKYILHNIANILEDVFIEEKICFEFPGRFKTGIRINCAIQSETALCVSEMKKRNLPDIMVLLNLILYYAKTGDVDKENNILYDKLCECIELIDNAVSDEEPKNRYDIANRIFIKIWKYAEEWIEEVKKNPSMTPQELQKMLTKLTKESGGTNEGSISSSIPKGNTTPLKNSSQKVKPDLSKRHKEVKEVRNAIEEEGGRFILEKTDSIDEGKNGSFEYNRKYVGGSYENSASDIERLLVNMAEEKALNIKNDELSGELQKEANKIRYGNAHTGVHVRVNRMNHITDSMRSSYSNVAPLLLSISRKLQKTILNKIKSESEGTRMNGLYMGRRLNARSLVSNDKKYFYNTRLPFESLDMAVGLLIDESGSMRYSDRITNARAASIILHDFCTSLNIPIALYGHTEHDNRVDLYAYSEFDHPDKNDKYRIMDMQPRSGNRDGAALRFVAERLLKRQEKIKILIIVSDGQPAGYRYSGTEAEADLRGIKLEYRNKGIVLFAAAIGNDKETIERIYKDGYLDISDLNKLPITLLRLLTKYI